MVTVQVLCALLQAFSSDKLWGVAVEAFSNPPLRFHLPHALSVLQDHAAERFFDEIDSRSCVVDEQLLDVARYQHARPEVRFFYCFDLVSFSLPSLPNP